MKSYRLILIFFIFCDATLLFGQADCGKFVEEANELYSAGNYDDCIQLLEEGLENCGSFLVMTKNRRERAYVLLINSSLEKDSLQAVDKYFRRLLKNNPDFKRKDYDEIDDFERNLNNYYVIPRLFVGTKIQYRRAWIQYLNTSDAIDGLVPQDDKKKQRKTFNTSLMVDYRLTDSWTQFSEIGYFPLIYEKNIASGNLQQNIEEKSTYTQWDIGTKYYYRPKKMFNPYLEFGMSNQFLTKSKLSVVLKTNPDTNNETVQEQTLNSSDAKIIRKNYVPYLILGGGAFFKKGNLGYGINFRRYQPVGLINDKHNKNVFPDLVNKVKYMDSNFWVIRSDLSLFIVYMFNNVKKRPIVEK